MNLAADESDRRFNHPANSFRERIHGQSVPDSADLRKLRRGEMCLRLAQKLCGIIFRIQMRQHQLRYPRVARELPAERGGKMRRVLVIIGA